MMKRLFIFMMLAVVTSKAQQLPQYSQYMLNQMAINPAIAGKDEFAEVRSNSRQQWVGITDAPRTYMLTLQGPFVGKNMGLGMNLYTDIVGPTRRTGRPARVRDCRTRTAQRESSRPSAGARAFRGLSASPRAAGRPGSPAAGVDCTPGTGARSSTT